MNLKGIFLFVIFAVHGSLASSFEEDAMRIEAMLGNSKQFFLGKFYSSCFTGAVAEIQTAIATGTAINFINEQDIRHCINLCQALEDPMAVLLSLTSQFPLLIAEMEVDLPSKSFALLFRQLFNQHPDKTDLLILHASKAYNRPLLLELSRKNTSIKNEEVLHNLVSTTGIRKPDARITTWALQQNLSLAPTMAHFECILGQVWKVERLKPFLSRCPPLLQTSYQSILALLEGGSMNIYKFLEKKNILNLPDPCFVADAFIAIVGSSNQEAPKVLDRLILGTKGLKTELTIETMHKCLEGNVAHYSSKMTKSMYAKLCQLGISMDLFAKRISSFMSNAEIAPILIDPLLRRNPALDDDAATLMKKYLIFGSNDRRSFSKSQLQHRLFLLGTIDPFWPTKVFDGTANDPILCSGSNPAALALFLGHATGPIQISDEISMADFQSLPFPLFHRFSQIYQNYPLSKHLYRPRHADPRVLFHLIRFQARPLTVHSPMLLEAVLGEFIPMTIDTNHIGWLMEGLLWLHARFEAEVAYWYGLDAYTRLSSRRMLQFQVFLRFFNDLLSRLVGRQKSIHSAVVMTVSLTIKSHMSVDVMQRLKIAVEWLLEKIEEPTSLFVFAGLASPMTTLEFMKLHFSTSF